MTAPTHDVAAEEAVIASCLVDADAIERCAATGLVPDDFFVTRARYTYGAIRAVAARLGDDAVNRVTVGYELAQRPAGDGTTRTQVEVVTLAWLSRIEEELPTSIGAEWYAGIVRECAQRRREAAVGQALLEGRATAEQAAAALRGASVPVAPPPAPKPVVDTTSLVKGALDLL